MLVNSVADDRTKEKCASGDDLVSPLLMQILVYGLGVVGGCLFAWAWFGDWLLRKRGKRPLRRCPRCWYDLGHTPGMRCSECGFEAERESQFCRSQRRKRWAAVALLLLMGSVSASAYPGVAQRGWVAVVPDWVLIMGMSELKGRAVQRRQVFGTNINLNGIFGAAPVPPKSASAGMMQELSDDFWFRVTNGLFADWEWRWIAKRALDGDAGRPPICDEWQGLYGNLLHAAIAAGAIEQAAVNDFAEANWKVEVRAPQRWPARLRYPVYAYEEFWSPFRGGSVTRGTSGVAYGNQSGELYNELQIDGPTAGFDGPIGDRETARIFNFQFSCSSRGESLKTVRRVQAVPPTATAIEEILTPVESAELTELIRSSTQAKISIGDRNNNRRQYLNLDFTGLKDFFYEDAQPTVGIIVELMRDGEVQFAGPGWVWTKDTAPLTAKAARVVTNLRLRIPLPGGTSRGFFGQRQTEPMYDFSAGDWTVRLRSDAETALLNFDCDEYWVGEVELPLTIGQ